MKLSKIIYSLNIEDVQTVALEELERELTETEIKQIQDKIAENIDWYSAIADAISTLKTQPSII